MFSLGVIWKISSSEISSYLVDTRDTTVVGAKVKVFVFEGARSAKNAFPGLYFN